MYYSSYYLFMLPALLVTLIAQLAISGRYKKYKNVMSRSRITGFAAARRILDRNGLSNVRIECIAGNLTDHFDPRSNVLRLSSDVYNGCSVASIGIAAHEAGHAVQYAESYLPIKFRAAIIPVTNIGSQLAIPLVIIGSVLYSPALAMIGVALFGFVVLFQLITLPVEFNASSRALAFISEEAMLDADELKGVKKVLGAAAMTYLAALFTAIMNLLRLLSIVGSSKRNDRR